MPKTEIQHRYFISTNNGPWTEVTVDEFAAAESQAGFHPTGPGPIATFGFSEDGPEGSIEGKVATSEEEAAKILKPEKK